MIYFLTFEKFLMHGIDYFTKEELLNFKYKILSNDIINEGRIDSVKLINQFMLPSDILRSEFVDIDSIKKEYFSDLDNELNHLELAIMRDFRQHYDLLIITTEKEYKYTKLFAEYIYKRFKIPVIDLNTLFTEGELETVDWDPKIIQSKLKKMVDKINQYIYESQSSTSSGRLKIMDEMSRKEKIKKLKSLGIDVDEWESDSNINEMLVMSWVEDD